MTKEAMKDAKKMGITLPISRSMEGFRFKSSLVISDLIIDELPQLKKPEKSPKEFNSKQSQKSEVEVRMSESDNESSDLEFTE